MINAVVLNWKRPQNMTAVLAGIRAQTVPKIIIVIDAGGDFPMDGADIVIRTSHNFGCLPRFFVPGWTPSLYTFQSDDDHAIEDPELFAKLIQESDDYPFQPLCYNGRILSDSDKSYQSGQEVTAGNASVCNFGFSFYPSEIMNAVPAAPYCMQSRLITPDEMRYADDLWISAFTRPRVSAHIRGALRKLDEGPDAITLSKSSKHMDARNEIGKRFFISRGIR